MIIKFKILKREKTPKKLHPCIARTLAYLKMKRNFFFVQDYLCAILRQTFALFNYYYTSVLSKQKKSFCSNKSF